MPELTLKFTHPHAGWLPVRIELDGRSLEFIASDVPNDAIDELYSAVYSAARGRESEVFWHLEPGGYYFNFLPADDKVQLRVRFAEHALRSGIVDVAAVTGTRDEILLPLWRALSVFASFPLEEHDWDTGTPPDAAALQRLRDEIAGARPA